LPESRRLGEGEAKEGKGRRRKEEEGEGGRRKEEEGEGGRRKEEEGGRREWEEAFSILSANLFASWSCKLFHQRC
jgi:hypothetical protein